MPIFTKKYLYLGPLEFFENENFDVRVHQNFGFILLKLYLTFGYGAVLRPSGGEFTAGWSGLGLRG